MRRLALLFACLNLPFTLLYADHIYVAGNVSGAWSADTVFVFAEIGVPSGYTLVIEPGVKVLFEAPCKFIVNQNAVLIAVGTSSDSIIFDRYNSYGHWNGIRFLNASDSSRLEYCHLIHGYAVGSGSQNPDYYGGAIYCSGSDITVKHCMIDECDAYTEGGGIYCTSASPLIESNTFVDNGSFSISLHISNSTIHNNIFSRNTTGIKCENSNPIISRNFFRYNYNIGTLIYCLNANATITGNLFLSNQCGNVVIECFDSNDVIIGNIIMYNNGAYGSGCGISCFYSAPYISSNIIHHNTISDPLYGGGGIFCLSSNADIHGNIISENSSGYYPGGGIACIASSPSIAGNYIVGNESASYGGGIYIYNNSHPIICANVIRFNTAAFGGGISSACDPVQFQNNLIEINTATQYGGGLHLLSTNFNLDKCTIVNNHAHYGGGAFSNDSNQTLTNTVVWGNSAPQFYGSPYSTVQPSYCDIEGELYPGPGNLNLYPSFLNTALADYRLLWGSPCIDSGDPDPQYNDPDGTRADMGAFYFDQSVPVRVLLSPHEIPYLIPETGGSMDYTIRANNWDSQAHSATIWCDLTLPDSTTYGPLLGPMTLTISAGQTLTRVRTQNVPASAPMGVYHYNAYAVVGSDTSKDSFMWGKLGVSDDGPMDWSNLGEDFTSDVGAQRAAPLLSGSGATPTTVISPNPFNLSTALSYELRATSFVSLRVYDTAGRLVTTLVDGWREVGEHCATFDGSGLAAGIYFARLTAGDFTQTHKLVLLK